MSKVLTALRDVSVWGRCGACVGKVWESVDLLVPRQQYPRTSSFNSLQPPPIVMPPSVHNELLHQRFCLITMVVCRCTRVGMQGSNARAFLVQQPTAPSHDDVSCLFTLVEPQHCSCTPSQWERALCI